MIWIEEILLINPNCIKSKSYSDNCNKNNRNIDNKIGNKK